MIHYSIKMPDMSRNMALAGQTVSTRGMNVTYNENGYAVKSVNYGHKSFVGTSKSIRAASKEAVLAAGNRAGYDGPEEDLAHFSDREFARAVELRRQVVAGEMSATEANVQIEEIRRMYGYSFGVSGSQYAVITLPDEQPEEVAKAEAASVAAEASSVAGEAAPVAAETMPVAPEAASVASEASSVAAEASSVQDAAPPRDEAGGIEQLRESYQAQLLEQQQRQTIYSGLEEQRLKDMVRVDVKEKISDVLLGLMDEEEDD